MMHFSKGLWFCFFFLIELHIVFIPPCSITRRIGNLSCTFTVSTDGFPLWGCDRKLAVVSCRHSKWTRTDLELKFPLKVTCFGVVENQKKRHQKRLNRKFSQNSQKLSNGFSMEKHLIFLGREFGCVFVLGRHTGSIDFHHLVYLSTAYWLLLHWQNQLNTNLLQKKKDSENILWIIWSLNGQLTQKSG